MEVKEVCEHGINVVRCICVRCAEEGLGKVIEKMNKTVNMVPLPNYGDLIPLEEWKSYVSQHSLIPYDGSGCWATSDAMDDHSDVWNHDQPEWATHVMWFNR